MSEIEHGTYGGWQQHRVRSVPLTEECGCRQARNEYMAKYREDHPEAKAQSRRRAQIRQRALKALADLHPEEFRILLSKEHEKDA